MNKHLMDNIQRMKKSCDEVINDYYSKARMKMEFNEDIARAWSNIGKENFDTL